MKDEDLIYIVECNKSYHYHVSGSVLKNMSQSTHQRTKTYIKIPQYNNAHVPCHAIHFYYAGSKYIQNNTYLYPFASKLLSSRCILGGWFQEKHTATCVTSSTISTFLYEIVLLVPCPRSKRSHIDSATIHFVMIRNV